MLLFHIFNKPVWFTRHIVSITHETTKSSRHNNKDQAALLVNYANILKKAYLQDNY